MKLFSLFQSMKQKQRSKRKKKNNMKKKLISDPRYIGVHTDPRFREAPKDETKIIIDSRFKHMFNHNTFFSYSAPIDKRGRPVQNNNNQSDFLRHYYIVEDEEEGLVEEEENDKGSYSVEEETNESNSTTTDDEEEEEDTYTDSEDTDTSEQEEVAVIEKDTYRLAVVNMDWNYVKAVDLYVVFNSFVPPNGMIKSVAVYPTVFGLQRMKEEDIRGPVLSDNEDEKSDEDNNEKLRAYQKSMMRFYHAVVECDSSTTAAHIYKECDGLEFLSSPLDLRFIPDICEFKLEPRDVVTEVPTNYVVKDFGPRALQHSKVDFTWDDDDPLRKRTLRRKFTDEQLAQFEWKDYLTSDASESDDNSEIDDQLEEKARKQDMYRSLVYSGNGSDEDAEHDVGQEMEVTFHSGLECLNKKLMEKKNKRSETVLEASLRKRREKKKADKNKLKCSSDDDSDQQAIEGADEFFIEEPCVKKRKKAQSSKNNKNHNMLQYMDMVVVDKASKEELELLLADDKGTETGLKGYNLKFKKGKDKMGKENVIIDESKVPNSTYSDDPRFAPRFDPDYAIDPTDPQFKRSAAYARQQLAHKQKKGQMEFSVLKEMKMSFEDSGNGNMMQKDNKDRDEFSFLVKSVKRKSKQILDGKIRKDGKLQFEGVEKKRQH